MAPITPVSYTHLDVYKRQLLGGALRVDTQAHLLARLLGPLSIASQLAGRVEHEMIRQTQQLLKFLLPVGGGKHMDLPGKLLPAQAGFIQAAGGGAVQIPADAVSYTQLDVYKRQ